MSIENQIGREQSRQRDKGSNHDLQDLVEKIGIFFCTCKQSKQPPAQHRHQCDFSDQFDCGCNKNHSAKVQIENKKLIHQL